jgi:metallo-beta-lactamase family protein
MAEHTLGRRIVERNPEIRIFGESHALKAEVAIMNSFSAHAGQDELVNYTKTIDSGKLKHVFLVHGEPVQAGQLTEKLAAAGYDRSSIPARGDVVELD